MTMRSFLHGLGLALMMSRLVVLWPFCGLLSRKAGLHAYQKCNHFKGLGCILRETESISHILKILIQPSSLTLNLASHPYLRLSSFERTILIYILYINRY